MNGPLPFEVHFPLFQVDQRLPFVNIKELYAPTVNNATDLYSSVNGEWMQTLYFSEENEEISRNRLCVVVVICHFELKASWGRVICVTLE